MKVTLTICTKTVRFQIGVANWYILGYELSVVSLTTQCCLNVQQSLQGQHSKHRTLSITYMEIVKTVYS